MALYPVTTYVTTRIYASQVRSMFLPGGETWGWLDKNVRRPMILHARKQTPVRRHGRLLRGMRARTIGTNQFVVNIRMWNDVDYALFVHEGHKTFPTAGVSGWLWVGAQSRAPWGDVPLMKPYVDVAPQSGNPWMRKAMEWALHRKGLIGG